MAGLIKRGRYWYGSIRENGKERRKSLQTTNKDRAREKLVEMARAAERGKPLAKDMPVGDFDPILEKHLRNTRSPFTVRVVLATWKQYKDFAEPLRLSDCTRQSIIEYRSHLQLKRCAPATVTTKVAQLASVFKVAIHELGVLDGENPATRIPLPKAAEEIPRFLNDDERVNVLTSAEEYSRDMHLVIALGLLAGLRKNEIVNAPWRWVKDTTITVQPERAFTPKGKRVRSIPIHPELRRVLDRYRPTPVADGYIVAPGNPASDDPTAYRVDFRRAFDTVVANSKIANPEEVTPHTLRHTFASALAMKGVDLYRIATYLGHTNLRTTQIYAHLMPARDTIDF